MRQYFHRDLSAIATPMTKPSIVPNYLVIQSSLFRAYFFLRMEQRSLLISSNKSVEIKKGNPTKFTHRPTSRKDELRMREADVLKTRKSQQWAGQGLRFDGVQTISNCSELVRAHRFILE